MRWIKDYWENAPSIEKSLSKSIDSIGLLMITQISSRISLIQNLSSFIQQTFLFQGSASAPPLQGRFLTTRVLLKTKIFLVWNHIHRTTRQRFLCAHSGQCLHSVLSGVQRSIRLNQLAPHNLILKCSSIFTGIHALLFFKWHIS